MTYDTVERSEQGRRPVELYTFFREFQAYRYTSADREKEVDGAVFTPRAISRSEISVSEEIGKNSLTITAQRDFEVADLFRIAPPSTPITFLLQQYHEGDGGLAVMWSGRIVAVEWQGAASVITLESVYTTLRRVGLRRLYQRQCPHVLYGSGCRVNREAYRLDAPADAVTGTTISVGAAGAFADGYFAGGVVEYLIEYGLTERRFITEHIGTSLKLNAQPVGLSLGVPIKIYPGCDHTITTCDEKFGNALNYGGMPYMTTKNPFGGDPVY